MIIDRFTEEYAYVEGDDGRIAPIPRALLPRDTREGDVLVRVGNTYAVDRVATDERRARIKARLDRLLNR